MTHKFDPQNFERLEYRNRFRELPPYEVLINLGLKKGDNMLDIGTGIGYFALPASKIVGFSGKVIATDISDFMIQEISHRILMHTLQNMQVIKTNENEIGVNERIIDFAFMCHVFHELENKNEFMGKIYNVIKKNGIIAIVDWDKKEMEMGPPLEHRVAREELIDFMTKQGYKDIVSGNLADFYYYVKGIK